MPWKVEKSSECPASKPWACIQETNGEVMGCHATKEAAQKQQAALYASEKTKLESEPPRSQEPTMTTTTIAERAKDAGRAVQPPAEGLVRVAPFNLLRSGDAAREDGSDGLTMDGFAAVFNEETLIDSWEGRFWEQTLNGSMRKTFRDQTPKIQFDHGTHPMIGSIPIGRVTTAREETHAEKAPKGGAHVIARLRDNWLIQPVIEAIDDGSIDGMSFRFSVVHDMWHDADGNEIPADRLEEMLFYSWAESWAEEKLLHRSLREVKVPELGPVVWPAYTGTSVGMRSEPTRMIIDLAALRSGNPNEQRKLAEAVFTADARQPRDGIPRIGQRTVARLDPERVTVPEPTEDLSAGDHTADVPDAPEVTVSADNHPSSPAAIDAARDRVSDWLLYVRHAIATHPVDD